MFSLIWDKLFAQCSTLLWTSFCSPAGSLNLINHAAKRRALNRIVYWCAMNSIVRWNRALSRLEGRVSPWINACVVRPKQMLIWLGLDHKCTFLNHTHYLNISSRTASMGSVIKKKIVNGRRQLKVNVRFESNNWAEFWCLPPCLKIASCAKSPQTEQLDSFIQTFPVRILKVFHCSSHSNIVFWSASVKNNELFSKVL